MAVDPMSNRKKVRGWKKQVRKIAQWRQKNHSPNLNWFATHHECHVKFWIDPWYRLAKRNPPAWYQRQMIAAMVGLAKDWTGVFQAAKIPFIARIYLHDPWFMSSQMVFSRPENALLYPEDPQQKKFPQEKFAGGSKLLKDFEWRLHIDEYMSFEEMDALSPEAVERLKKQAYTVETISSGDTCYHVRTGDVWVGTWQGSWK